MSLGHRFVEKNTSTVFVCGYEYTSNLRHRVDFFTFLRYNFCNKEVTEGNRMIDDNLEKLISQLPASPTVLNKSNVKKIHEYIPVPTDYKIRWADISSFGGYPAGIVIADRGLIVKATRTEVKHNNGLAKVQKKESGSKEKIKPVRVIYQIIPWEYYSPDDYEVVAFNAGKDKVRYLLTPEEQDQIIAILDNDEKKLRELQQSLLKSAHQEQDVIDYLTPHIGEIIKKRHIIGKNDEIEIGSSISEIVLEGGLAYGV